MHAKQRKVQIGAWRICITHEANVAHCSHTSTPKSGLGFPVQFWGAKYTVNVHLHPPSPPLWCTSELRDEGRDRVSKLN